MRKYHFAIPIFDFEIKLIYCELLDFKKWLTQKRISDAEGEYDGLTINNQNSTEIIIFVDSSLRIHRKTAVIYHESLHASNYIFNFLNIKQDTLSDEGVAYLQTFIADKILKRIG